MHQYTTNMPTWRVPIPTSKGEFIATFSNEGLTSVSFPMGEELSPTAVSPRIAAWAKLTKAALDAIIAGKEPAQLPPFMFEGATEFQKAVWAQLTAIPLGRTRSYGEIAETLGKPGAARAVGAACGANPIPVLIPCHRVLASNRKLGGFSGGLDWKIDLLKAEGIRDFRSSAASDMLALA